MLLRFLDPDDGTILVDGVDVRTRPVEVIRAAMALVPQETFLLDASIRDNLLLARPDATPSQIIEAARRADILELIESLPDGIDTHVGERASRLSGGQRQRLAIARAILRDAPLLILDEATSSVDVASEADIRRSVTEAARGRTMIVIAHRLATVADLDRVIVMEHGRIVESGSPAELAAAGSTYARLLAADAR